MDVEVVRVSELSDRQLGHWTRLQEADVALASPFFRPEFTQAVADVRNDVFVGTMEGPGRAIGFFPFQRRRWGIGVPVGGERSNYHGVIADPGAWWDARALLRGCRLGIWDFHHLIASQAQFDGFQVTNGDSFVVDLPGGFAQYAEDRRAAGSRVIPRLREKARRLEREVGAIHFEPHVADLRVLRTLMHWKSEQYRRTAETDRFAIEWNVRLLERIHSERSTGFSGMLAAVYAGDRLAAVVMGLRAGGVFHWWFPAYEQALARYSPGLILLLCLAENADALGLHTIDLGKDHEPYKERWATSRVPLAGGSVTAAAPLSAVRTLRRRGVDLVRRTPLAPPAQQVSRSLRLRLDRRGSRH
jgi:CelD/BcsL family acetyltransferase involved in cellulose biosynthesis